MFSDDETPYNAFASSNNYNDPNCVMKLLCPHPLTPSPKLGEGEPELLLPSPSLGEGLGVRAEFVQFTNQLGLL
jgi:hypothetical protein